MGASNAGYLHAIGRGLLPASSAYRFCSSPAFSIVEPAGTWAWRSGPVDAAAGRQGAVLALLPVKAAVQLRAEAAV
jgi:hypothetical protein